ncbi:MAG: BrnT family toxin [Treponema sp.]|nr:BrnT family toxin [Treponema sp.]MCL2237784.1 BrnT family toxin [Treponema sp.]
MIELKFEWDPEKEQESIIEHGIYFKDATRVFYDFFRMERHDDDSSSEEERWQTMGYFEDVLFVVYTERGDAIRIISARVAEPFERRIYHGNSEIHGWRRVNS